jgi:hypothetical protein
MTPPVTPPGQPAGAPADGPGWLRVVPNKYPAFPGHEVVVHGLGVTSLGDLPGGDGDGMEARPPRRAPGGAGYMLASKRGRRGASLGTRTAAGAVPDTPPRIMQEAAVPSPLCHCEAVHGRPDPCPPFARAVRDLDRAGSPPPHAPLDAATGRALADAVARLRGLLGAIWPNALVHGEPGDEIHWHRAVAAADGGRVD